VRGIIVHRKHLYVADEAGDTVKVFEVKSGRLVARIMGRKLTKPVHLILHGDTLYIGAAGTGSILAFDIPAKAPSGKLKARAVIDGKLKAPSGFAIGPDGDLYVAERIKQWVRRFSAKGKKKGTFIDKLPDMPEFLVHVPDRPSDMVRRPSAEPVIDAPAQAFEVDPPREANAHLGCRLGSSRVPRSSARAAVNSALNFGSFIQARKCLLWGRSQILRPRPAA
jgi:hypothetical protein